MKILSRTSPILASLAAAALIGGCTPSYYHTVQPSPFGRISRDSLISSQFSDRSLDLIEGIWAWEDNSYEIAVVKKTLTEYPQYQYIGILTESNREGWKIGETKVLFKPTVSQYVYSAMYFMGDKSSQGTTATMPNENMIEMSLPTGYGTKEKFALIRLYPNRGAPTPSNSSSPTIMATGTGFFITGDVIATNYHVVKDAVEITIDLNGNRFPATLVMKDQVNDLALLCLVIKDDVSSKLVLAQMKPLEVGDVRNVKDGDKVFTVGYPLTAELGRRPRISEGIINSTVGLGDDPRMLQMSVPVQPGNSGGPLFNIHGDVIGIVTSTANNAYFMAQQGAIPQNVNFAVKINYLANLLQLLPGDNTFATRSSLENLSAAELMQSCKSSIVLIEASKK